MKIVNEQVPLFSIIIAHYNQHSLWKTSLLSVLEQKYEKIQIIFADDHSDNFDIFEVECFIKKHANSNLIDFKILQMPRNEGTVKNLNCAYQYCKGTYLMFIAADDALYDENVLMNYAHFLNKKRKGVIGIYARSLKCNVKLESLNEDYILKEKAILMNGLSAKEQYRLLTQWCCIPIGATAFRKEIFDRYAPFDLSYVLIEDWPFFLRATREGGKFLFCDFPALLYREGGVSRPLEKRTRTLTVEKCFNDHLRVYEKEIWPYSKMLSYRELEEMLSRYDRDRTEIVEILGNVVMEKRINYLIRDWRIAGIIMKKLYLQLKSYLFSPFI